MEYLIIKRHIFTIILYSLDAAFKEFCEARQPGIYKEGYITELYEKYHPGEDILPDPPQLPTWHTECDDEDEGL